MLSLHPRLPTFILGCLAAALLATPLSAQVQINYTNGQTDATNYDTSSPNDPTTLSILSGTATQSGVISGTGQVIKVGAGTLVLSGFNTYTSQTLIRGGTLEVVTGGRMSHINANLTVADQSGDSSRLLISGGTVGFGSGSGGNVQVGYLAGSSGTVDVTGGTWIYGNILVIGNGGTGVVNISGGSAFGSILSSGGDVFVGELASGRGTVNLSGGTLTSSSFYLGDSGNGVFNISGGSAETRDLFLGTQSGSSGTVNMTGGNLTISGYFAVGSSGTGVLNIAGGTMNSTSVTLLGAAGTGTANVSGGTWTTTSLEIASSTNSTGVLNITDQGTVTVKTGNYVTLAGYSASAKGTLNLGTGGVAGTLNADIVFGGSGTAVVNFNHTGSYTFAPTLTGTMTVNKFGHGTTTLTAANTYLGDTVVYSGTLDLGFGTTTSNILPTTTNLYLGNGTLSLTGEGTQTLFALYAIGSGSIVLGQNQTLDLGQFGSITPFTALNFDTSAGGADGATVGSGVILVSGQTAGSVIYQTYTVTDSTGFGLATVNASNQIIRATSDLLPASGATYSDYRIDNNAGDSTVAGSSSLVVTSSQAVVSVTVDTTAAAGVLTLAPGLVLSSNIWNFGSVDGGGHAYEITGGAGIKASSPNKTIQINNINSAPVTISTSILDSGSSSGLAITGSGTTILTAANTYLGSTIVYGGVLEVADGGSISSAETTTTLIGADTGPTATLLVSGGSVSDTFSILGNTTDSFGTATVSSGSWTSSAYKRIGFNGTGVMNVSGGSVSNGEGYLGYNNRSSGTVNVSGGTWTNNSFLSVGHTGTGVMNVSGGSVSNSDGYLGYNSLGRGTVNVTGGSWTNNGTLFVGYGGTGVLNLSGGSMSSGPSYLGFNIGSSGTANISGGTWTNSGILYIGHLGTGVLNISGGSVSSSFGYLGYIPGSNGTANVSGGTWLTNDLYVGFQSAGQLNLTGNATLTVFSGVGSIYLGSNAAGTGTLNIGTGGAAGTLNAGYITGGAGSAVVNFNHNEVYTLQPTLFGTLTLNQIGSGTTRLIRQNTFTGTTSVLGGTLELSFGTILQDILPSSSPLNIGGGTLLLTGAGTQTFGGLSTVGGAGSIVLGADQTLTLGALGTVAAGSAVNFNTATGGADGATVGSGVILLSGQTAGSAINSSFTVTDSTGFGLATVNASNQIIRLTSSDLLPATGADSGTDYRIDNNAGDSTTAGSAALVISASESARSITVDTTTASGILTLAPGAVLSTDVWNFGGAGWNAYAIDTEPGGSGLSAATAGGVLQINNYNTGTVSINAPILDNGGSGLSVGGTGTTLLNGSASYTGETVIRNGSVFLQGDFSAATGDVTVQNNAALSGDGTLGGALHVQSGGLLKPGNYAGTGSGMLSGTSASFDSGSIFAIQGSGSSLPTLHLTGAVTIAAGALLSLEISDLTATSYTLISAASGLDSAHGFTLDSKLLPNYELVYDGTTLKLNYTRPITAFWTGKVDKNWSSLSAGSSNWSTAVDGVTDTAALPGALTDVTFSATGVGSTQTNLDEDYTLKSLTVDSDTGISTTGKQTLTVNNSTTVNALLAVNSGVTLLGKGDLTVSTTGTLAGSGAVEMAPDRSIFVNGAISVGDPSALPGEQVLSLTTSGTGAIVMGADSTLSVNLYLGAGQGDNTASLTAADQLSLHGTLNATAGGTLVIGNPTTMTSFLGGDQWKVIDLNGGAGSITGTLAVNDSALGLTTGFVGSLDQATGIYSIADIRPELTAYSSGLAMANAEGQAIISGVQTALNDVNNHLFNLRSGSGEEEEESDGSISAALDYGVVVEGEGDGPEKPMAKRVKRSRQWEVFTTVNYGNARLNPISNQSGVQVDSWASSVGIERHLSRGLTLGFAATFLQSTQTYTGGLGKIDLEGPMLSAYLAYARKGFWGSLLYSFGAFDLGSQRNPGLGLPSAAGGTNAYTNAIQFNTGYNFRFQDDTLVTGPFVGIDYLHGSIDAYSETGGGLGALSYARQTFESLVTRVGWSTSKRFDTSWATITPQFRLSYERQNVQNNGTSVSLINAPFTASGGNQTPGQDYMVIGTGVNFQFTPDFSMLLGYQVQLFRNNMEAHFGSVRFGYKF